jgi:hypothetical protein
MEDRDLLAARHVNAATLADAVLLLLVRLRRRTASMSEENRGSLDSLVTLLRGSANGAESLVQRSDLSPVEGRSLSEDLQRYDQVRMVKRELSDAELKEWTDHAADVVERLRVHGLAAAEVEDDEPWIRDELEPFLEELSRLDGLTRYESDPEARPQPTVA